MRILIRLSLTASATACMVAGLTPIAAVASASVNPHAISPVAVTEVNLHARYTSFVAKERPRAPAVVYARGHQTATVRPAVTQACAEPACPLSYNGGAVQHHPKLYLLLWGPNWSTTGADAVYLTSFLSGLGVEPTDSWSTTLTQYHDTTGSPSFSTKMLQGVYRDMTTPPTDLTDAQQAAEADAFYSTQGLTDTVNDQIVVATQSGICPVGFYAPTCDGGSGSYCAWHSSSTVHDVPYTTLPYLPDSGSGCGEGYLNSPGTYDGFSIVEGHEFAETISDPYPVSGWYDWNDPYGGEIGDKCSWRDVQNDSFSTGAFPMQPLWSNSANACVHSTTVTSQTVQDSSPLVTYNAWSGVPDSLASGGTYRQNSTAAGTASYKFTGTSVKWATIEGPDKGIGTVIIDGITKATLDLYSSFETTYVRTFSGLTSATHTIQIRAAGTKNLASLGYNVPIDALIVGTSTIQDNSSKITYGTWAGTSLSSASGGSYRSSKKAGATATFSFFGSKVDWITTVGTAYGKADVILDGSDLGIVDLYSSSSHWQTVKSYATSGAGQHTIVIKVLGTKRSASSATTVVADAFVTHP